MKNLLLPYYWKLIGVFLGLLGIVSAILYTWFDFRFSIPVFAVYSAFFETKLFTTFRTNFADELTLILLICSMGFIVFSKEKNETEGLDLIRLKALARAVIANFIFLLLSVMFIYGSGFIVILVVNIFSLTMFYLIFFYMLKFK